jgi:hypothetical protein
VPGIAAAGKSAVSDSHSAAPTGALYSSIGEISSVPFHTRRSGMRVRSNGA